jgi:hypothetical protein
MASPGDYVEQLYADLGQCADEDVGADANMRGLYNALLNEAKEKYPDDIVLKALNPLKPDHLTARTLRVFVGQLRHIL